MGQVVGSRTILDLSLEDGMVLIMSTFSPGVVEEFKVQTATFDASYGFMGGAAINMSLKSATNSLHGQTCYFMQNPALNANSFLSNLA